MHVQLRQQCQLPEAVELVPLDLYTYSARDGQQAPASRGGQIVSALMDVSRDRIGGLDVTAVHVGQQRGGTQSWVQE